MGIDDARVVELERIAEIVREEVRTTADGIIYNSTDVAKLILNIVAPVPQCEAEPRQHISSVQHNGQKIDVYFREPHWFEVQVNGSLVLSNGSADEAWEKFSTLTDPDANRPRSGPSRTHGEEVPRVGRSLSGVDLTRGHAQDD